MTEKKTILITGCSSGIGRYSAIELQKEGWNVVATARKDKDLAALEDIGVTAVHLDYANTNSIHSAFEKTLEMTDGRLDALFNNGAYGQPGAVEDLKTDVLRKQFEANFFGWHELTVLCIPIMRKQGHGRIINCSSILGWVHSPWRGAYNASKYALEGLTSTMRLELEGTNIYVSLIEPGPIWTKFSENALHHFLENIDQINSPHAERYQLELQRLENSGGVNRFRLGCDAVHSKLLHALNADRPKAHYPVTIPTHFMNVMRRILPTRMVDRILIKSA